LGDAAGLFGIELEIVRLRVLAAIGVDTNGREFLAFDDGRRRRLGIHFKDRCAKELQHLNGNRQAPLFMLWGRHCEPIGTVAFVILDPARILFSLDDGGPFWRTVRAGIAIRIEGKSRLQGEDLRHDSWDQTLAPEDQEHGDTELTENLAECFHVVILVSEVENRQIIFQIGGNPSLVKAENGNSDSA